MASAALVEIVDDVAPVLSVLGNAKRLAIMCHLKEGELSVGAIAERVGLSQSALSQHLARLREVDLVATRRERQMVYYCCTPGMPPKLLDALESLFTDLRIDA